MTAALDPLEVLRRSRALWNRTRLDLGSDELVAQILERGTLEDWRALYRLAAGDVHLRARLLRLVRAVPLPMPWFWLAALAALGERVDWDAPVPEYADAGV